MVASRVKIAAHAGGKTGRHSSGPRRDLLGEACTVTVSFVDRTLTCRDCGREFLFTAGEQEFYQSRGLQNEPRRCPECRAARRQADGNGRARVMHDVICSNCGKPTQVPFVPTGARPVYCLDCFQTVGRR